MNPGLVVKLRPAGPWRIGPDSGARNRVDMIYHSDSLYSAVTSAMSRMDLLEAWLAATARSQSPAVCFSSCFPFVGTTAFVVPPRTLWPPASPSAMSARVRWKSARFIPLTMVESILAGKKLNENSWTVDGASGCLMQSGKKGPFLTSLRWNAAVDRLNGSSERHGTACIEFREGCGLWTVVGFRDEAVRDEWQEPVKAAFRLLADTGFGGERSRGWGRAETPEFVAGMLPDLVMVYKERAAGPVPVEEPETEDQPPVTEPPEDDPGSVPVPPHEEGSVAAEVAAALEAAMAADRAAAPVEEVAVEALAETPAAAPTAEGVASELRSEGQAGMPVLPAAPTDEGMTAEAGAETPAVAVAEVAPTEESAALEPAAETAELAPTEEGTAVEAAAEAPEVVPTDEGAEEAAVETAAVAPTEEGTAAETPAVAEVAATEEGAASEPGSDGQAGTPVLPDASAEVRAPRERAPMRAAAEPEFPRETIPSHLKAHWLLSLFTPAANDAVDWGRGNYAVLARGGRIESPAAGSGELKKQIQMVTEGSVLYSDGAPLGAAADVAPDGFAHPVFRSGFALAIPLPEVH